MLKLSSLSLRLWPKRSPRPSLPAVPLPREVDLEAPTSPLAPVPLEPAISVDRPPLSRKPKPRASRASRPKKKPAGLTTAPRVAYTDEIKSMLAEMYTEQGAVKVAQAVKQTLGLAVSPDSVRSHARRRLKLLGASSEVPPQEYYDQTVFTPALDLLLVDHYTVHGAVACARLIEQEYGVVLDLGAIADRAIRVLHQAPWYPLFRRRKYAEKTGQGLPPLAPPQRKEPPRGFHWEPRKTYRVRDGQDREHLVTESLDRRRIVTQRVVQRLDASGEPGRPRYTFIFDDSPAPFRGEPNADVALLRLTRSP